MIHRDSAISRALVGWTAIVAMTLGGSAGAEVLDVPGDYTTIQDAIVASIGGDEIVVAPGTYNEVIDFLGKGVTVRSSGGAAVTTIDGTGFDTTVVRCDSDECGTSVLDGFTITGGAGVASGNVRTGGGMYNSHSSPTVRNCIFDGNVITVPRSIGGGMYNVYAQPLVTNCSFTGNEVSGITSGGGGMFNLFSTPRIVDCTFEANSGERGGGIGGDYSDVVIVGCTFTNNSSGRYGGGVFNSSGTTLAIDCVFVGNTSSIQGGGMMLDPDATLVSCVFESNEAIWFGGAIDLNAVVGGATHSMFRNCRFDGNRTSASGSAGAIYQPYTATYENCRFTRNEAGVGGGALWTRNEATVRNCTFAENRSSGIGGGIRHYPLPDTVSTVTNSIFWGNEDGSGTGESAQIHVQAGIIEVDYSCVQGGWSGPGGTGIVSSDPLFADPDGDDNDPETHGDNDYRLVSGSPCVDAGENATANANAVDMDGQLRLADDPGTIDTGSGEAPLVDMGCSEHVSAAGTDCNTNGLLDDWDIESGDSRDCNGNAVPDECEIADDPGLDADETGVLDECEARGDLDGDGRIGVTDLIALLVAWGPCDYEANCGRCPSDFNHDGVVSILDLVILLTSWS